MFSKFLKFLQFVWCFPVTFFGLIYALTFWALGWNKWNGRHGDALVWHVNDDKAPAWLLRLWKGWGGHAIGNVVVLRDKLSWKNAVILLHEEQHVAQCMRLGVLQPIIYAICLFAIRVGCKNSNPYFDNIFECDARRGAGQTIDIVGELKKKANARTTGN